MWGLTVYVFPQVVRDTGQGQVSEFVTVKVQEIFVTCVHLYNRGEEGRIKDLKRIWDELQKKSLWKEDGASSLFIPDYLKRTWDEQESKEDCAKHIFAGDFNSLTWEDYDEEGWEKVATGMKETNMKLEKAEEKRQEIELAKYSNNYRLKELEEELESLLTELGIGAWYGNAPLKIHLKSKKLEEPKFDLTKLMKNNGFRDSWKEVEDKIFGDFGQTGTNTTCQ